MTDIVWFGDTALTIEDVWDTARRTREPRLSERQELNERIARSCAIVDETIRRGGIIYGVTTGYGDSCETTIPPDLIDELPVHLARYHRCGTGRFLTEEETRAVMAVRLSSLVQGWSGVTPGLVALLAEMLRLDILPPYSGGRLRREQAAISRR